MHFSSKVSQIDHILLGVCVELSNYGNVWGKINKHYRSARNTRRGGAKIYSTPPYRSNRWAKMDHIWARDPSGESIKGHRSNF